MKKLATQLAIPTLAFALGACGGDGEAAGDSSAGKSGLPPGHVKVNVIDEWAKTLTAGDVEEAAELFSLPSVVENGTRPLRLDSRREAIAFNRSLPCGAELVEAHALGRYIAATFRLTERPGAGECGSGTGGSARTAFLIRDGEIVQWRRLPDLPEDDKPSGPVV